MAATRVVEPDRLTSLAHQPLALAEISPDELLGGQEAALARDIARMHARSGEFVVVSCPACGQDQAEDAFTKYGFQFVRCLACGTIYMSPRPSEDVVADYYASSENYAYWAEHIFPATEAAREEKIHRPRLDRVVDYCRKYAVATDCLVEVGPGFGTFFSLARGAFHDVVVIEPTPELAEHCRRRGARVLEARVEDAGKAVQADVVCAFEVIEHMFAPAVFARACAEMLRPGGLLVLSCPNGEGFDVACLGAASPAVDNEHLNLFNPRSLAHLLRRAGLEVLAIETPGRLDAELVRLALLSGEAGIEDRFLRRILLDDWERLHQPFQSFLAQNQLSSHMWAAARKPALPAQA